MNRRDASSTVNKGIGASEATPCTFFAMPKAFRGHVGMIQRNAIGSWLRLTPRPEVILFGDDDGVAEYAAEHGVTHEPLVSRNEHGTPLMDDMFRRATTGRTRGAHLHQRRHRPWRRF